MLSRSEPREEIEIATNKITAMFLNFGKSEPQRSYKHGSYKKKKVYIRGCVNLSVSLSVGCTVGPLVRPSRPNSSSLVKYTFFFL